MFSHFVDGSCSSDKSFTAQQIARMHCYLDLVHSHAIVDNKPSAIPLPMQVMWCNHRHIMILYAYGCNNRAC